MLLHRILEQSATRWPEAEALLADERQLTYEQWNRRVNRVANAFGERGIGAGDRVAVLTRNRIEQATAYFATQKLGAVAVPLNFRLSRDDLVHLVTTAEPSILLYDADVAELVSDAAVELTPVEHYFSTGESPDLGDPFATVGRDGDGSTPDDGGVEPTDVAVMMHTSGTTGRPKLVMTDHRSVWANALACGTELGFRREDRALHIAPMFHSADYFNLFLPAVLVGAANVMQPFFDPDRTFDWIQSEDVTCTLCVPTHLNRMRDRGAGEWDLASLRLLVTTAAPIADEVVDWITDTLCERFYNVYGLTETTGLVTIRDQTIPSALPDEYCIGMPFLNVDVRLVELEGGDNVRPTETVEQGDRGRLITRAPKLMRGYYRQPERTAETLRGEWLYTNDVVREGTDGRYYLIDRIDNAINTGGEAVYPLEVERALRQHPAVVDCIVTDEPDDDLGETVVAFVLASDESLSASDIERFWKTEQTSVADYKRPRKIRFVDELPRER